MTWTTTGSPYIVTCSSTISATLIVNAGVTVKFASATRLLINGKLTAIGTAASPITFTSNSATPAPGNWRSIYFGATADPTSKISYATVSYGGATDLGAIATYNNYSSTWIHIDHVTVSYSSSSGIYIGTAILSIDTATITNCSGAGITANNGGDISNSTVSNNGTYGVNITGYAWFSFFTTTISNNGNYAIGADSTTHILYLWALTLTGNGGGNKNAVGLRGGGLITNSTWRAGANWEILGSVTQPVNGTLTIAPGLIIRFASATRLQIDGKLMAIGTDVNPITFTSNAATPAPGNWRSIYFGATADPTSRISYATVSYGGATDLGAIAVYKNYSSIYMNIDHVTVSYSVSSGIYINAGIVMLESATITNCSAAGVTVNGSGEIRNSTVSNNGTYGVNIIGYAQFGFYSVTISNNGNYAIGADSATQINYMFFLTLMGNGGGSKNAIGLRAGPLLLNSVWHSGAVWEILGSCASGSTSTHTIDPGVTARFTSSALLTINGTLLANGTATAPIIFTSNLSTPTNGSWQGIYFEGANSNSRISYATVAFGGNTNANYNGAIVLSNSAATLDHVTILNSPTYAIRITGTSPIKSVIRGGMFANNTSGGILNTNTTTADATINYWNDPSGPSGVGPGSGQSVSAGAKYDPWLTAAPATPHFFSNVTVLNQRFNATALTLDTLTFDTSTTGNWTTTFRNSAGTIVRTFTGSGTSGTVAWDGKDQFGTILLDGTYTFLLESVSNANETAAPVKGIVIIDSTKFLQIQNLNTAPAFFSPNGDTIQDTTTVTASFNYDDVNWTLNFKSPTNAIVRTVTGQGQSLNFVWDGKDSSSTIQPDGVYTADLLVSDGTLSASGSRTTTLDNTFPAAVFNSPTQDTVLSNFYQQGNMIVTVTVTIQDTNLQNWILDRGTGATPSSWTTLVTGTSPSNNEGIYMWDTSTFANGVYTLRLQVWDKAGNRSESRSTVTVGNTAFSQNAQQINVASSQTVTYNSAIPFTLTETLVIKNAAGNVVRTLVNGAVRGTGSYNDVWNGKTSSGAVLPDGPYFYVATLTDGTTTFDWDLSSSFIPGYQNLYDQPPAWDPFNNGPATFTYDFTNPGRVMLVISPFYWPITSNPPRGAILNGCYAPNACLMLEEYQDSGPQTVTWAGVDSSGIVRNDMKGFSLVTWGSAKNAVVLYGTKPQIGGAKITVNPPRYRPGTGNQTVSFTLTTYQNQNVDVAITYENLETHSVLRTINSTGVSPGTVNIAWDGKADNGMWVAPGTYLVTARVSDSIGNQVRSQILATIRY